LVTGDTGSFTNLSGIASVFTTSVSGATVTGDVVEGTYGTFVNLSGSTITGTTVNATTGVFDTLAAANLAFTNTTVSGDLNVLGSGFFASGVQVTGTLSGTTFTGTVVQATTGTFTSLVDVTTTGVTATFVTGLFTSLTGTTTTGVTATFTSGQFTTRVSGATVTGATGAFTSITGSTLRVTTPSGVTPAIVCSGVISGGAAGGLIIQGPLVILA